MARYSGGHNITFERLARTVDDARSGELISHAVNTDDRNHSRYAQACEEAGLDPNQAWEVEALDPHELRERLDNRIESLVPDPVALAMAKGAEEDEKMTLLERLADREDEEED
jgi:hypothetical protein